MNDLSLHILDIVQNSIRAGARLVRIGIIEDLGKDVYIIRIEDDGKGMDEKMLQQVSNPFFTSRTTRKVGLGIPLLKQNAEMCEGNLEIRSIPGTGTKLEVEFKHSHIDRPPKGNLASTIKILIAGSPEVDYEYSHKVNANGFEMKTTDIKNTIDGIPINEPEVLEFIESMIQENVDALHELINNKQ